MDNKEIEKLMIAAIEYHRPESIKQFCMSVWNQPFFYKIDKAKVLTLSYNPTDKGARTNYKYYVDQYIEYGKLDTNTILDILYNYKKEVYWRKNYDIIFNYLGFQEDEISHMDVSFFPYKTLDSYKKFELLDDSYKFLLQTIKLLDGQLKIIFVDGAKNKDIICKIMSTGDWRPIYETAIAINGNNKKYDLLIYKCNSTYLIYYGCFLYGATCPSHNQIMEIARHIKSIIQ